MLIKVNGKEMKMATGATVSELAKTMELPEKGVALAVNNKMIPRTEWADKPLEENDTVVIIKAACGG